MTKGTLSIEIECADCGTTVIEVPDDAANSTIIYCSNGHRLGPYDALKAAIEGQAHTVIFGAASKTTFKPIKR